MAALDRVGPSDSLIRRRGADEATASWPGRPSFLAFWRAPVCHKDNHDNDRGEQDVCTDGVEAAPELACLRGVLTPAQLRAAARRGRDLRIGADRVLVQWGMIDESAYLQRLGRALSIAVEDFAGCDRDDCPLTDAQIPAAAASGLLPLRQRGELIWVVTPQRLLCRALCRAIDDDPAIRRRLRLASAAAVQAFLARHGRTALADAASAGLRRRFPTLSAAPRLPRPLWQQRLRRGACVSTLAILPFLLARDVTAVVLAAWFVGFAALRLLASLLPRRASQARPRRPDAELPIYTVVAALYHEAASVGPLLDAIDALDYPREKLDLIVVIEPDDFATRAALAGLKPRPHLRVLVAPRVAPQTKPKALNYALAFARGSFIAVLDAEDRPNPDQLRAALAAFDAAGPATACVQASLCIDNLTHSWLSRTFVAEYAGQFDLFLPGLAALGLPLPLGGTSNHFRTKVLRALGAWDPHNVTEDADLGFRLARFGYRSTTIASTTYEEAPVQFGNWLRQRTRWMKGWIQTWAVHMRAPLQLWREIGPGGVLALNLIVGGNVVTALAYPLLLIAGLTSLAGALAGLPTLIPDRPSTLHWLTIAAGLLSTVVVGLLGLARRRQWRHAAVLALTPLYWLCLSLAAWRALAQFVWCPFHWEKTEHGVARRARHRGPDAGRTAPGRPAATGSASSRPRPPRASA